MIIKYPKYIPPATLDVRRRRRTNSDAIVQLSTFWTCILSMCEVECYRLLNFLFVRVRCARIIAMNFQDAITNINNLLAEKQPQTFNRAWVRVHAHCVYRFIQKEIRIESGGIDWDRITRALNPKFQKQWKVLFARMLRRITTGPRSTPYFSNTTLSFILSFLQKIRWRAYMWYHQRLNCKNCSKRKCCGQAGDYRTVELHHRRLNWEKSEFILLEGLWYIDSDPAWPLYTGLPILRIVHALRL